MTEEEFWQISGIVPAEQVQAEPDRSMFVIAYAAGIWAIGFATALSPFGLSRLRRLIASRFDRLSRWLP